MIGDDPERNWSQTMPLLMNERAPATTIAMTDTELAARVQLAGCYRVFDLLADVACVALNRVQPRYIRHAVDLAFFLTEPERQAHERAVDEAVDYAFGFVQARHLMAARR